MAEPATLTEEDVVERERAAARADEAALPLTKQPVAVEVDAGPPIEAPPPVAPPPVESSIVYKSLGQLRWHEILHVYELGRKFLKKKLHERWRMTFAAGLSTDGLFVGMRGEEVLLVSVYWRTKNPNVRPDRGTPVPSRDGNFVYVCWLWSDVGDEGTRALRDHLRRTCPDAEFVAHHDARGKQRRYGELVTVPLTEGD